MRGDVIEFVDRRQRRWKATLTALRLWDDDEWKLIIEGYAADVAQEIVRRVAR